LIPIDLLVEDDLSEAVTRKVLACAAHPYAIGHAYGKSGFGYLKSRVLGFNQAARSTPYCLLTDLDRAECPPALIADWLGPVTRHPNLIFRVAVREVEAWLLAHREAFAAFAGIRTAHVPANVEEIDDPKRCLIDLVRQSRKRSLREDIVPPTPSTSRQGPNYNGRLALYVHLDWDPHVAKLHSSSLRRMIAALDAFAPAWTAEPEERDG
jgi:hypothetical protein